MPLGVNHPIRRPNPRPLVGSASIHRRRRCHAETERTPCPHVPAANDSRFHRARLKPALHPQHFEVLRRGQHVKMPATTVPRKHHFRTLESTVIRRTAGNSPHIGETSSGQPLFSSFQICPGQKDARLSSEVRMLWIAEGFQVGQQVQNLVLSQCIQQSRRHR